jgi:hypothetical protein
MSKSQFVPIIIAVLSTLISAFVMSFATYHFTKFKTAMEVPKWCEKDNATAWKFSEFLAIFSYAATVFAVIEAFGGMIFPFVFTL